jgi:hypothetical protein
VNGACGKPGSYAMISRYLGAWLAQLGKMGDNGDYRVISTELEEMRGGEAVGQHHENLNRLNCHLCVAAGVCGNFEAIFSEKRELRSDLEEANRTILDKLAEVRAIVGLDHLGFEDIRFVKTPDFHARFRGRSFLVEVTRFGASQGNRSDVWDSKWGSLKGGAQLQIAFRGPGGKSSEALFGAVYAKVEGKYPQFEKSQYKADGNLLLLWISLGRDYLAAGKYELPDVQLNVMMNSTQSVLDNAVRQIKETGSYSDLSHVVLSRGRDYDDLVSPRLG